MNLFFPPSDETKKAIRDSVEKFIKNKNKDDIYNMSLIEELVNYDPMKEDKYYTPSIEEFHVGFELEVFAPEHQGDTETYDKTVIYESLLAEIIGNHKYHTSEDYRVKYLDQEDIESLGWEDSKNRSIDPIFTYSKIFDTLGKLYLAHNTFTGTCSIYAYNKLRDGSGRFNSVGSYFIGTLKNKSKLKEIMQMIEIG